MEEAQDQGGLREQPAPGLTVRFPAIGADGFRGTVWLDGFGFLGTLRVACLQGRARCFGYHRGPDQTPSTSGRREVNFLTSEPAMFFVRHQNRGAPQLQPGATVK